MSPTKTLLHPKRDMNDIAAARIPDSKLAREVADLVRDTESGSYPIRLRRGRRDDRLGIAAGRDRLLLFARSLEIGGPGRVLLCQGAIRCRRQQF